MLLARSLLLGNAATDASADAFTDAVTENCVDSLR